MADAGELLRDARESAERVRLIVRDLRIFSRSDEQRRQAADVERVLESSLRMARNEIRHRARLVKAYQPVPPVEANEPRLGQVFLNLLINAAQALPEGGSEHHEIRVSTALDPAGRVVIEVRDTGAGIPPEVLARLFEPFFTTKAPGVGTGLGLYISQRIVSGFGGEMTVESEVGRGTAFRGYLPVASGVPVQPTRSAAIRTPSRRGRVLIIDDEPVLTSALKRVLAPLHDVTTETSARAALVWLGNGERFDLILCDLMMPKLTGMDFYAEARRLAPEQVSKIAFMTGGAFTESARRFLDSVPKPEAGKAYPAQRSARSD